MSFAARKEIPTTPHHAATAVESTSVDFHVFTHHSPKKIRDALSPAERARHTYGLPGMAESWGLWEFKYQGARLGSIPAFGI